MTNFSWLLSWCGDRCCSCSGVKLPADVCGSSVEFAILPSCAGSNSIYLKTYEVNIVARA